MNYVPQPFSELIVIYLHELNGTLIDADMESLDLMSEMVNLIENHHILVSSIELVSGDQLKFYFLFKDVKNQYSEYVMVDKQANKRSPIKFDSYKAGLEEAIKEAKNYLLLGRVPYMLQEKPSIQSMAS